MIVCVCIPRLMAVVERRAHPEWVSTPLVFVRHVGKQERVYAASEDAEGIRPGMRISQAQTMCPEALLVPVSFTHCANAVRSLVEKLQQFSEVMEVKDDFYEDLLIYIDLGKLRPRDGLHLGACIREACADLKASVGIAGGKFTAFVAAQTEGVHLIRPGEEAAFLAPLPITLLPLERAIERTLWLLGIERLGQFAALSKTAVTAQFGKDGIGLWKLASGLDSRTLRCYRLSNREQCLRVFEDNPIESRDLLMYIMDDMIRDLSKRLERAASSTQQITLVLHLDRAASVEDVLDLRQPLAREADLQRVLVRALEKMQASAGVTGIEISLDLLLTEQPRQLSLFEYMEAQEHKTEQDIKRLAQRFGSQRFLRAVPGEATHPLPGRRFRIEPLDNA